MYIEFDIPLNRTDHGKTSKCMFKRYLNHSSVYTELDIPVNKTYHCRTSKCMLKRYLQAAAAPTREDVRGGSGGGKLLFLLLRGGVASVATAVVLVDFSLCGNLRYRHTAKTNSFSPRHVSPVSTCRKSPVCVD